MAKEPLARGVVVTMPQRHAEALAMLQREASSILRALDVEVAPAREVPGEADYVALLIEPDS
ncbi:MAG TPA: hypothetical protein VM582_05485, partial [Candidatus Thermoplasmatota archaeon]|nr:hypothetical protein [Candidatus Thermoplasmatota archaeon]